jgi:pyruvate kinase
MGIDVNRRTKIVCTLWPATATPDRIRELIQAGMDVARLNFSHGDRDDHKRVYDMIRHAADAEGHLIRSRDAVSFIRGTPGGGVHHR